MTALRLLCILGQFAYWQDGAYDEFATVYLAVFACVSSREIVPRHGDA
jgi:hypothetical protein